MSGPQFAAVARIGRIINFRPAGDVIPGQGGAVPPLDDLFRYQQVKGIRARAGTIGDHQYAVARLVTAILMGAGAGYLIYALSSSGLLNNQLHGLSLSPNSCCGSDEKTDTPVVSGSRFWNNFWSEVLYRTLD